MEFRRFDRSRSHSVEWKPRVLTFEELGYQVKTALSGFYVSNQHAMWPRRQNVPEEVRIVDDDDEEIVAYTIHDLIEETRRVLLRSEPPDGGEWASARPRQHK